MLDFGFYNMDCMDGMKKFPAQYFDLAIVDPPYGINAANMKIVQRKTLLQQEAKPPVQGSHPNRKGKGQYPGTSTAEKLKKGRLNRGAGKLKNCALQKMNCDWDFARPTDEYWKELFRVSKNQIIRAVASRLLQQRQSRYTREEIIFLCRRQGA